MKIKVLALVFLVTVAFQSSSFAEIHEMKGPGGSHLVYEDIGSGEPPLVFIHCWSCNRHYWKNEAEPFSKDFRLILLDLPGHGESQAGEKPPVTVEAMAKQVVAVMDKLGLKGAILIGSSMGGPISLEVAHKRPKRVRGIIGVDNLHNVEIQHPRDMFEKTAAALAVDYSKGIRDMLPYMFTKKSDPKIVEWTVAQASRCDPKVCIPLFRNFPDMNVKKMMKDAHVPIRNINALPYHPDLPRTSVETNQKYADFDVIEMSNVGHFIMLEKPDEFNAKLPEAIEAVLAVSNK